MCTYARTIYECNHEVWGARVKRCAVQLTVDPVDTAKTKTTTPTITPPSSPNSTRTLSSSDTPNTTLFDASSPTSSSSSSSCRFKMPHGLQSRKLNRKCDHCQKLDDTRRRVLDKLCACREAFTKKWPEYDWDGATTLVQIQVLPGDREKIYGKKSESGVQGCEDNRHSKHTGSEHGTRDQIERETFSSKTGKEQSRDGWICSVNGEIEPCNGQPEQRDILGETY